MFLNNRDHTFQDNQRQYRSILIVKLGAIGDVVMALSLLSALRKKHPKAHITWLCGKQVHSLIQATNLVDEIDSIDEKELLKSTFFGKTFSLLSIWRRIGLRRFDLILTLQPDPRYRLLSLFSFGKQRQWKPRPGHYHAEEYLHFLGLEQPVEFPSLKLPPSSMQQPFIVIAPGGAKNTLSDDAIRRWPIEHYSLLIRDLSQKYPIVVTGSETDQWVLSHLPNNRFQDLIGKLSLLDTLSLLQKASLLITHDSGPLHLAKLVACPVLALFGPTRPEEKLSTQENIQVIWNTKHLDCCPCYNGKTYARCQHQSCLKEITPLQVSEKARKILQKNFSQTFPN